MSEPIVVPVHGAFAGSASGNAVIGHLSAAGVTATANPLSRGGWAGVVRGRRRAPRGAGSRRGRSVP